jgi:hypothetical protein
MTFGRCKGVPKGHQGTGFELPHQGVSSVGERGHRLTERRPPFLGEEQALAVKDADPRRFRKVQIRQVGLHPVWMTPS